MPRATSHRQKEEIGLGGSTLSRNAMTNDGLQFFPFVDFELETLLREDR